VPREYRSPGARFIPLVQPAPWTADANCLGLDPDLFFPDRGETVLRELRVVCMACTVRQDCLEAALYEEQGGGQRYGFRGGMSPKEREREHRRRQAA